MGPQTGELESGGEDFLPEVYDALRCLSAHKLANEAPGQTLQATAWVHEAWLRVGGNSGKSRWKSRTHFFAVAAEAMRRILIDNARRKQAQRHGGGWHRVDGDEVLHRVAAPQGTEDELIGIHDALDRLSEFSLIKALFETNNHFVTARVTEGQEVLSQKLAEPEGWLLLDLENPLIFVRQK